MKTLKFRSNLIPLVMSGEKTSTWRAFDDKDLQIGDELELLEFETKKQFARARIIEVIEKPIKDLNDEDWIGHEKFKSLHQMYAIYSHYYKQPVKPTTIIKVIKFELLD